MTTIEKQIETKNKILLGLEKLTKNLSNLRSKKNQNW